MCKEVKANRIKRKIYNTLINEFKIHLTQIPSFFQDKILPNKITDFARNLQEEDNLALWAFCLFILYDLEKEAHNHFSLQSSANIVSMYQYANNYWAEKKHEIKNDPELSEFLKKYQIPFLASPISFEVMDRRVGMIIKYFIDPA